MQLIVHNEPYTNNIPDFNAAYWAKHGELYNLILMHNGENVLTFHDIDETDKENYALDSGDIPMMPEEMTPELAQALIGAVIDLGFQLAQLKLGAINDV